MKEALSGYLNVILNRIRSPWAAPSRRMISTTADKHYEKSNPKTDHLQKGAAILFWLLVWQNSCHFYEKFHCVCGAR